MSVIRERQWTKADGTIKSAWVVIYTDGTGKRRLKTFAKNKAARDFKIVTDKAVMDGTHVAESVSVTVAEAASNWLAARRPMIERSTVEGYQRLVDLHIVPFIGRVKLSKLDTATLAKLEDDLRTGKRSLIIIKATLSAISMLIADAMRRGHVNRNVAREYQSSSQASADKRAEKRARGRLRVGTDIPSRDEIRAIVDALSGKWRAPILTAIFTGLRSSELRGLRWGAVDFNRAELHVRERVDQYRVMGAPKSAAGDRTVPLPPLVVNALRQLKLASINKGDLDHVFISSRDGRPMNHGNLLLEGWQAAQVKAGVVINGGAKYTGTHAMRHFYASWLINAKPEGLGLSPKAAQTRLGHSSIVMTYDTYGHLFPRDDEQEQMADAERALLG